jgi:hypothetical protein
VFYFSCPFREIDMSRYFCLGCLSLLVASSVGCEGTQYTCDCYCVKTNPVQEEVVETQTCVPHNIPADFEAAKDAECPVGFRLSGCDNCTQDLDYEGDPIKCDRGFSRTTKRLIPIPDERFAR